MADNITAIVKDGVVQTGSASSLSLSDKENTKGSSSLDKDAFLQLLVAQMKYQDPLQPTDNTQYISQLANFSELEEMQNLSATMSLQRASALVGQEVVLKVSNSTTGGTEFISGQVDYVVYENNKAYVAIDEQLYSVDDIYEVINPDYSEGYALGKKFVSALASFPAVKDITLEHEEAIKTLRETYDAMTDYQKSFIAGDAVKMLESFEQKIRELKLAQENS